MVRQTFMETLKHKPSVFSYTDDMKLSEIKVPVTDASIMPGENLMMQALYGYRFLTKNLIKKNFRVYGHTRLDSEKILKSMIDRNIVKRYCLSDEGHPNLDFYILSDEAMQEHYGIPMYRAETIPYILESMAVSQFHLGALESSMCRQYLLNYEEIFEEGMLHISSVIMIKSNPKMYVAPVSSPRNSDTSSYSDFIKKIVLLNEYMKDKNNIFRSYILVIICESETQIKTLSRLISENEYTRDILVLYSLDEESNKDRNPLERLHNVKWMDNVAETEIINLLKR